MSIRSIQRRSGELIESRAGNFDAAEARRAGNLSGFYNGTVHLWPAAQCGLDVIDDGDNVILHEFAHALDVDRRIVAQGRLPGSAVDLPSTARR